MEGRGRGGRLAAPLCPTLQGVKLYIFAPFVQGAATKQCDLSLLSSASEILLLSLLANQFY